MLKRLKDDIITGFNIFNDNKISITPLNNIVEGNNKKSYFSSGTTLNHYWDCVKSNRKTDINKVCDAVNNGVLGLPLEQANIIIL
jgi:hypothetical protein